MMNSIERVSAIGIIPVIAKISGDEDCECLAGALASGGIPVMEITFRMRDAERYIGYVRRNHPEITVGAGTVLTLEQAKLAIEAGAHFLVAPGLNPDIVEFALQQGIDIVPGVATPSEVDKAVSMGLKTLKFFPAEQSGGAAAIKAICGPYKGIKFIPTGGLNLSNIADYFALDEVAACGGTYMLGNHLAKKEWGEISALCRRSLQTMLGLKLAHIGINAENEADARSVANDFAKLLSLDIGRDGSSSIFVDSGIEVTKSKGRGECGHIAYSTANMERAVNYFKAIGTEFDAQSAKLDDGGKLKAIYFANEIGGFAVHLVKA